jgi:nicotinate phosphoribosyltransferase
VTASNQPALDGVYKLSAIRNPGEEWKYKLKLSEQMIKISNPGILQVKRFKGPEGYAVDAIYDTSIGITNKSTLIDPLDSTRQKNLHKNWSSHDLLVPIFEQGKCVYQNPPLNEIRDTTQKELSHFHSGIKRFIHPHEYIVGMEKSLYDLKVKLITNIRNLTSHEG